MVASRLEFRFGRDKWITSCFDLGLKSTGLISW